MGAWGKCSTQPPAVPPLTTNIETGTKRWCLCLVFLSGCFLIQLTADSTGVGWNNSLGTGAMNCRLRQFLYKLRGGFGPSGLALRVGRTKDDQGMHSRTRRSSG